MQAIDDDSIVEYSLMMNSESSALSSLLHVDEEGSIRNVEPLLGLEGRYQFAIIARDGRHTGDSATVFLTILPTSKCQPTFPENVSNIIYVNEVSLLLSPIISFSLHRNFRQLIHLHKNCIKFWKFYLINVIVGYDRIILPEI